MTNGTPSAPFKVKKRVRQGDLWSPYLFVLAMEYLTRSLKGLKNKKNSQSFILDVNNNKSNN